MHRLLQTICRNEPNLLEKTEFFINRGDDLNEVTEYGGTALRAASYLGRFDVVKLLLDAGADRDLLQWDEVIHAVVLGELEDVRKTVHAGGNLEAVDHLSTTPYLFAIQIGSIEKASLLLELGSNRHALGYRGKTPFQYAIEGDHMPMLQWLLDQGYDIESSDEYIGTPLMKAVATGKTASLGFLLAHGANIDKENHFSNKAINAARSLEVVQILLAHGADVNDLEPKMRAKLLGVGDGAEIQSTREEYLAGRFTFFGTSNPEEAHDPFRVAMIRADASAWRAKKSFSGEDENPAQAIWNYDRMGRTTTILPDGRIVEIGGEHEDSYRPDFCIYNDVVVFETDGSFRLLTYPEGVFSPTDFHTATLVGCNIVIIGSFGYPSTRKPGLTPVYRLNIDTFEMERMECAGEGPGWIHKHKATIDPHGGILIKGGIIDSGNDRPAMENLDEWQLDTADWRWARKTNCGWNQWYFVRKDQRSNHLWEIRQAIWAKNTKRDDEFQKDMAKLAAALGHEPELDSVAALYLFDEPEASMPARNNHGRKIRVLADGITLRIDEDHFDIHIVVEGILPDARIKAYQDCVLQRLARLEGVDWDVLAVQQTSAW